MRILVKNFILCLVLLFTVTAYAKIKENKLTKEGIKEDG